MTEYFTSLIADDFSAMNALIADKIHSKIGLINELGNYIVDSGGKRIRPILLLLSSQACAYQGREHIALAAMVEFFHTASLLHDDVVDASSLRRGRETANEIWGSKASILVGDYLFSQSVQLSVDSNNWAIVRLMAKTARELSIGEVKQLTNRYNSSLSIDDYLEVITAKTAVLFAASASIGAILAQSSDGLEQGLYDYGLHLGRSFQLIDDALDYCADAKTIGKNIGDDLADGKVTLPLLHVLKEGDSTEKALISKSLAQGSLENFPAILDAIKRTKAIEFTQKMAEREKNSALASLEILPESIYKKALQDLAEFAMKRAY